MEDLIDNFVKEALAAPSLFLDLAKVELYISESYRARTLIELIQNADDCGASEFTISQSGSDLLVSNNGKQFNSNDIVALCRSGSSSKKRGAGTIGYRGIGFKSTVGICKEIEIYSGNYSFLFSKELTRNVIGTTEDVPLIRIPHHVKSPYNLPPEFLYVPQRTVFIFKDVDFRLINEEIDNFDISSCIFLKNLKSIELKTKGKNKSLLMSSSANKKTVSIGDTEESWVVIGLSSVPEYCKIAMKLQGDEIHSASKEEALIHAFLPTNEPTGAALKFNGDFSTDPSRKFVDYDLKSEDSYSACCQILTDAIEKAINEHMYTGIFRVFENSVRSNKLKEQLLKELSNGIKINNTFCEFSHMRLCPDWLSYTDYINVQCSKKVVSQDLVERHPEILKFLSWLGVKNFTSSEILLDSDFSKMSVHGVISLLGNYAKKHRFTIDRDQLEILNDLRFIPYDETLVSPNYLIHASLEIPMSTMEAIGMTDYGDDIKSLFKSLNLIGKANLKSFSFNVEHNQNAKSAEQIKKTNIKKWRSVELNLKEFLDQFESVLKVTDVSKAHVGYDLKVQLKSGRVLCVEVKSIKGLNSDFEITNNELAVATEVGEDYFVALVVDSEEISNVKMIQDPINSLKFEKRVKVISWVCDDYNEKLKDVEELL